MVIKPTLERFTVSYKSLQTQGTTFAQAMSNMIKLVAQAGA